MKKILLCLIAISTVCHGVSPSERAKQTLSEMNITEKMAMMHGVIGAYIGNIVGNERLGIPSIKMQDGPQGFRTTETTGKAGTTTAWPSSLSIASSWDSELMYRWAEAVGLEFKKKGANMALAPGIGLARVPNAGRNFEYICGEDPFLGAQLVGSIVKGIQDQGVIANAKHWINNEIEEDRKLVSSNVRERVRFEIYYTPFQAAVDAGVLSVMCSYNRINGISSCENNSTMSDLKDIMGFSGWVISDWLATYSTVPSVQARLDQEMPLGVFFSEAALTAALDAKTITVKQIDASVLRILTSMYTIGLFDTVPTGDPRANVTSDANNLLAREIAAKSTVLLKNDANTLPLDRKNVGVCIQVFGDDETVSGGGSGHVTPAYTITPARGLELALVGTDTVVYYDSGANLTQAAALAARCDTAVVVVATTSCEGSDRASLALGKGQDELVLAVAAASKRTIVSVVAPGAVLLPWADAVPAVVVSWMPGQEFGNALADVIFGAVNPSARLPVTMPNVDNEVGFTMDMYPGVGKPPEATYSEELLVGYRWYDAKNVAPRYPFGHGLSYTTFEYRALAVTAAPAAAAISPTHRRVLRQERAEAVAFVDFSIENTGGFAGAEVPQLYLGFPEESGEPPRQLKGFTRIFLEQNQSFQVRFTLTKRDFSTWDEASRAWVVSQGEFQVFVGASSRDIRLTTTLSL